MSKYNYIRYLAYFIEILIFYVLEQTPYLLDGIFGVKPLIIISSALSIAMLEKRNISIIFSIFTGFLMDMSLGGYFGFNTIIVLILCYLINILSTDLIKTNLLTSSIVNIVCITIVFTLQFLFLYVFKGYEDQMYAFMNHYLPLIVVSFLVSPLMYLLNKLFFICFRERE
ncbi:MAG: rod shape-determining protein MreD [Clostridia bacterium]|nr:rod shape-determining protein MreD [Clostridia bacterium]